MVNADASAADNPPVSHNLLGQRLGRKGRGTRERILAATERLLAGPPEAPISLSAVAREASLGMTTLYLYFSDLTELLLAALEPVMASAEEAFVARARARWPDEDLNAHCVDFVQAFHTFWRRHTRILHLRNQLADANDERMVNQRLNGASHTLIALLLQQMDGDPAVQYSPAAGMATLLITAIERTTTISTDLNFVTLRIPDPAAYTANLLRAEARMLELCIRDSRATARAVTR